ncbi:LysR family transcriptional regulator [Enterococcus diestrammenae]|uniref:LysR family transcriptional regulator n=1 Tax=Enterococcus diestrammenae TaxID=1155073 RepID=UPI0022E1F59F|nr:LysR family transcriptional regulator [Enterococcus diestrammenae]
MDIHKLEIFIDLTKTLSYTETAARQFTTQSNISKQIQALEKELNITLFDRSHRQITLTKTGEILLSHAINLIAEYQLLQQDLQEQLTKEELSLSILTIPTMANYQGFSLITQFLKEHPEINLQLKEGEGNQLLLFLEEQPNHLIFVRTFETPPLCYDVWLTEEDRFVAVIAKTHPFAHRDHLQLIELKNEQFVLLEKETLLYQPTIDLCREAGFEPQILFKSSRVDLLLNMVSNEIGVTILMEKTIEKNWSESVKIIPIAPTKVSYLSFLRKKNLQPKASQLFWNYLKEKGKS